MAPSLPVCPPSPVTLYHWEGPIILCIFGSRDFPYLTWVAEYVYRLPIDRYVISGGARGVDTVVELVAKERGMPFKPFKADWNKYGRKKAGWIRNHEMQVYGTHFVGFWDGSSPGTGGMIEQLRGYKPLKVCHADGHWEINIPIF